MESLTENFIAKCNDTKWILHLRYYYIKLDFTHNHADATKLRGCGILVVASINSARDPFLGFSVLRLEDVPIAAFSASIFTERILQCV